MLSVASSTRPMRWAWHRALTESLPRIKVSVMMPCELFATVLPLQVLALIIAVSQYGVLMPILLLLYPVVLGFWAAVYFLADDLTLALFGLLLLNPYPLLGYLAGRRSKLQIGDLDNMPPALAVITGHATAAAAEPSAERCSNGWSAGPRSPGRGSQGSSSREPAASPDDVDLEANAAAEGSGRSAERKNSQARKNSRERKQGRAVLTRGPTTNLRAKNGIAEEQARQLVAVFITDCHRQGGAASPVQPWHRPAP